jgi:hypothetical protein
MVSLALAGGLAACDRVRGGPAGVLARRAVLERQVAELTRLLPAAEQGGLLPKDKLVVAISERMANALLRLALPREQVVGGRYRVRLTTAEVRFRDEHGSVRFDGSVGPVDAYAGETTTGLALFGVVDAAEVDRETGVLRCNVSIQSFELTGSDVSGLGTDVLKALAFPIAVPVRLEQQVEVKSVAGDGPVQIEAASLPLHLAVTDLAAHGGRLWVTVDVAAGTRR